MGAACDRGGVKGMTAIKTASLTLPASTEDLRKLEIGTVMKRLRADLVATTREKQVPCDH